MVVAVRPGQLWERERREQEVDALGDHRRVVERHEPTANDRRVAHASEDGRDAERLRGAKRRKLTDRRLEEEERHRH